MRIVRNRLADKSMILDTCILMVGTDLLLSRRRAAGQTLVEIARCYAVDVSMISRRS